MFLQSDSRLTRISVKAILLISLALWALTISNAAMAQIMTTITSDDDFDALINGNGAGVDFDFDLVQIFRLDPLVGNSFSVDEGEMLVIEAGITVQMEADFILLIEGRIQNSGDDTPITFQRIPEHEAWESITIVGNADNEDNDGSMSLKNAIIEGGGTGAALALDVPDWRGLIKLTGPSPTLDLGKIDPADPCVLRDSESNGIVVHQSADNFVMTVENTLINQEVSIPITGIKISDINQNAENELNNGNLSITNSEIQYCGAHGLAVYFARAGLYSVIGSNLSFNGEDNPIEEEGENLGAGVYCCFQVFYNNAGIITIDQSQIEENTWDGVRMRDVSMLVQVREDEIFENGWSGIYQDFTGSSRPLVVEKCQIHDNEHEGIFVHKGSIQTACTKIRGNTIWNNAADEEVHANILLKGKIGLIPAVQGLIGEELNALTEILNNSIEGATYGIELLSNAQDSPTNVRIANNIQQGAEAYGLYVANFGVAAGDEDSEFRNNIFSSNGASGIRISAGITDENLELWIRNNLIFGNVDFGIECNDGAAPEFIYNGFYENGAGGVTHTDDDCSYDAPTTVLSNPLLVNAGADDFHLLWNSPVINRGIAEEGFNDSPYLIDPEDEESRRDGSRNDMGAYGGPGAADWGFDPYCAVPSATNLTTANVQAGDAERDYIEWDYYRVFGSITSSATLQISNDAEDAGKPYFEFIYNATPLKWTITDDVHVNSDGDNPNDFTTFAGYNDATWEKIHIQNDGAQGTVFEYAEVTDAEYGFYVSSCDVAANAVILNNIYVHHCERMGIYIYDSQVTIDGTENEAFVEEGLPDVPTLSANSIQNTDDPGDTRSNRGIYIDSCPAENAVNITGTMFYNNGSAEAGNYIETGMGIFSSYPTVSKACFLHNGTTGVSCLAGGGIFDGDDDDANDFRYNGSGFGAGQGANNGIDGAEIYITGTVVRQFNYCDFVEVLAAANDPRGYIVTMTTSSDDKLNQFTYSYWADGDPTGNLANYFFYPDVLGATYNNVDGGEIDDALSFAAAKSLYDNGQYAEADALLKEIIASDPNGGEGATALNFLFSTTERLGEGYSGLKSYYSTIASEYEGTLIGDNALLFSAQASIQDDDPETALTELQSIGEMAELGEIAILAQVTAISVEINCGLTEIDAVQAGAMRERADELLLQMDSRSRSKPALPASVELISAYPNPFNSQTKLRVNLQDWKDVNFAIYDVSGREVAKLIEHANSPVSEVVWDASGQPAGLYFARLSTGSVDQSLRLINMK